MDTVEPDHSLTEPLLVVMAQGGKRLLLGDQAFEYRAGQCLVVTTDLPVTGHFLRRQPGVPRRWPWALTLRSTAIAAATAAGARADGGRAPPADPTALATGDAGPNCSMPSPACCGCSTTPTDAAVLAPLVEQEILWRLLTGPHGAMVRQIGLADSGLSQVSQAIRWIRDNYAEPMRIADSPGWPG